MYKLSEIRREPDYLETNCLAQLHCDLNIERNSPITLPGRYVKISARPECILESIQSILLKSMNTVQTQPGFLFHL